MFESFKKGFGFILGAIVAATLVKTIGEIGKDKLKESEPEETENTAENEEA